LGVDADGADDAHPADGSAPSPSHAPCDQCPCPAVGLVGASHAAEAEVLTAPTHAALQAPVADAESAQPERPQWARLA
jgi:hypothetical protein